MTNYNNEGGFVQPIIEVPFVGGELLKYVNEVFSQELMPKYNRQNCFISTLNVQNPLCYCVTRRIYQGEDGVDYVLYNLLGMTPGHVEDRESVPLLIQYEKNNDGLRNETIVTDNAQIKNILKNPSNVEGRMDILMLQKK